MEILWALQNIDLRALLDIIIVAVFFFSVSFLFRGTQALALLRGMLLTLVGLILLSSLLQLQALGWVLQNLITVLIVAIPVIFQPELRRVLEQLGRGTIFVNRQTPESIRSVIVDEICQAAEKLAERRHGALIVLQRNSTLQEFIRTGIPLDSEVNASILLTIFWPKTELHDGAAIIDSRGRIASAASVLPLTASRNLPSRKMGTRHRAALGISEITDALCVVVSEETGKVAVTNAGRMVSRLDTERLRTLLNAFYGAEYSHGDSLIGRVQDGWQTLVGRVQSRFGQS
ncbi:MAG TPA: diadenylate cyclase CdaA [Phototrophicaceae bacterium]|nr:diadenylate cyclase CdaA [Phototrophicaceae bacterium]